MVLKKIIEQVPRPVVNSTNDVFHDLMSCIIEQQIHYRSTKKIFAKALERASLKYVSLDNFYLFEKLSLSQIKLSGQKIETIISVVEYWQNNTLDFNLLSDDAVIRALSSIKGIGNWTIDMLLLYTLQRPNIFPLDDFHLKQIMIKLYNLDQNKNLKAQMIAIAEGWENQKSMAVLYLLEAKKTKFI